MKGKNQLPYDQRNMEQAGQYNGPGLPTKYGKKKGTMDGPNKAITSFGTPPRKY